MHIRHFFRSYSIVTFACLHRVCAVFIYHSQSQRERVSNCAWIKRQDYRKKRKATITKTLPPPPPERKIVYINIEKILTFAACLSLSQSVCVRMCEGKVVPLKIQCDDNESTTRMAISIQYSPTFKRDLSQWSVIFERTNAATSVRVCVSLFEFSNYFFLTQISTCISLNLLIFFRSLRDQSVVSAKRSLYIHIFCWLFCLFFCFNFFLIHFHKLFNKFQDKITAIQ